MSRLSKDQTLDISLSDLKGIYLMAAVPPGEFGTRELVR